MLDSASAHLKSINGMHNLACDLLNGTGIQKNEKEAVNYYLKALQNGFMEKTAK